MSIYIPPRPMPAAQPAYKAGPLGPGAGVLQTEYPLLSILGQQTEQERMRQYAGLGRSVLWIRAAENVIGNAFAGVPYHLEDSDGDSVEPNDASALEQEAQALLDAPMAHIDSGQRLSRSALWRRTSRITGLCGSYFWLRDQPNAYGIPLAFKGIDPWRMWPDEDARGNLTGWHLDKSAVFAGIPLRIDQVIHFMFEPPDMGHFGIGLVESALLKARITVGLDEHIASVVSAGGRLSGFLSPKSGDALSADNKKQLVNDFRGIVEQKDAAKRLQVVSGPIDFTATTMTPEALQIVELMAAFEDDLLALWGVPKSMLGLHDRGHGLGSSTVTTVDDETLWKAATAPRLRVFGETLQTEVFDLFATAGEPVTLVLDVPSFEDDKPKYETASLALSLPLRNVERRALLGLDPFGDGVIGASGMALDDEIWMPSTQVLAFSAAEGADNAPEPVPAPLQLLPSEVDERASAAAGEVSNVPKAVKAAAPSGKGIHASLVRLRESLDAAVRPRLQASVREVLDEQRREIAGKLRRHADQVKMHPHDTSVWYDAAKWDARLTAAMTPPLLGVAQSVNLHVRDIVGPAKKATPTSAVDRVLRKSAARITGIDGTTREKVTDIIVRALDAGWSILEVADYVEGITTEGPAQIGLDATSLFDDYRAEMIARTELMDAYNQAALGSYQDAGLTQVQAIDGDGDEECAARDGQIFDIDEADSIEDHPNGTLDWVPVVSDEGKAAAVSDVVAAHEAARAREFDAITLLAAVQSSAEQVAKADARYGDLIDALGTAFAQMPAPVVNLPPAIVNVAAPVVPPIDVTPVARVVGELGRALAQKPTVKTVERDTAGRIQRVREEPA